MNFVNVGVCDDYKGKVSEGLDAVSEAGGENGQRKVCGAIQGRCGERRTAMSMTEVISY